MMSTSIFLLGGRACWRKSAGAGFSTVAGVVGHGVDLVSIERVGGVHARFRARFVNKVLSADERDEFLQLERRNAAQSVAYLAARWAAKEATYKALGRRGVLFSDISVRKVDGRPVLELRGSAQSAAQQLSVGRTHLSLTHEGGLAFASVLLCQ